MYYVVMSGGKLKYEEYIPLNANFTMRTFTSYCLYIYKLNNTWKSDGCVVRALKCFFFVKDYFNGIDYYCHGELFNARGKEMIGLLRIV